MPKPILNQQDRNAVNAPELGYIADFIFEKTQAADEISAMMVTVGNFLADKQLILNVDDHTLLLKKLLYQAVSRHELNALQGLLEKWAAGYPAAAEKARQQGEVNRRAHARQPVGIYRGLSERHMVDYQAWGEDLDILVALRHVITTNPNDMLADGVYILPPVSLEEGVLADKIDEVCKTQPDKKLTLLVPVNRGQHHWQLAIIELVNGEIDSQSIWDSIKAGVQKNGYSCMDYTVQRALCLKFGNRAPEQDLQNILTANDALAIREAIVNRILNVHEKMQTNQPLHESVHSQMNRRADVEIFSEISEDDEDRLHAELLKNREIQEEFDASMAAMLEELYKTNNNQSEAEQFVLARKFAYQELLRKYGLFSEAVSSAKVKHESSVNSLNQMPGCVKSGNV